MGLDKYPRFIPGKSVILLRTCVFLRPMQCLSAPERLPFIPLPGARSPYYNSISRFSSPDVRPELCPPHLSPPPCRPAPAHRYGILCRMVQRLLPCLPLGYPAECTAVFFRFLCIFRFLLGHTHFCPHFNYIRLLFVLILHIYSIYSLYFPILFIVLYAYNSSLFTYSLQF